VTDELDRALAAGISSLAAEPDDADAVLASLRPRLHRARTRHRVALVSATAFALLAVASLSVALGAMSTHRRHVLVSATPTTPANSHAISTSMPSSTSIASNTQRAPSTTTAPRAPMLAPMPAGGTPPVSPTGQFGGNSGPATTTPPRISTTPSTASGPALRTYDAPGGSVTVRFTNGSLALVSYTPAAGYTAEVHDNEPGRVEVRFSDGDHESRIRLQVDKGQLVPDIESS
jgi:hypothetical protein